MMRRLINHIKRQPGAFIRDARLFLLLAVVCSVASCLDETLQSSTGGIDAGADDTDIYLSVNVPRTYALSEYDKENAVKTLDVLVSYKSAVDNEFYVKAACKGTLTATNNTFQVVMPVGTDFQIHVFINCHDEMVTKDFYNSKGLALNAMLKKLTVGADLMDATSLPMYGYKSGVTIDKTAVNSTIEVKVLRAVAAAQVMLSVGDDNNPTPGEQILTDDKGNTFELREFYLYFYPDSGRVAPSSETYKPLGHGDDDETRDVTKVSLPENHQVIDTRWDADGYTKPYHFASNDPVGQLGTFYLYENKPWSETGDDVPPVDSKQVATTRLVVGGVYTVKNTPADVAPKVTYYRIDFTVGTGDNKKLAEILRNHKYIFSIDKVSGPGYDTPDEAALGTSRNIYAKIIDWVNILEHVDFDGQNYFYSSTKYIVMPRDKDSQRSIAVKSDIPVDEWELSLPPDNERYKVEKAGDGESLIFTVLKDYDAGESEVEVELLLKAKGLTIHYKIIQKDESPDDWGNGGEQEAELGE